MDPESGKPIVCRAEDLTRLFCKSSLDECFLAGKGHRDAICSFVNKELLHYEQSQRYGDSDGAAGLELAEEQ